MHRRSYLRVVSTGLGIGVAGCLAESDGTGEDTETPSGGEETRTVAGRSSTAEATPSSSESGEGRVTIEFDATGDGLGDFERLELGVGKITLTPRDGEAVVHRVLDEFDVADGLVTVVGAAATPAGSYSGLSLTATVGERELAGGGSPRVSLGVLSVESGTTDDRVVLASGQTVTITLSVTVSIVEDGYQVDLTGLSASGS